MWSEADASPCLLPLADGDSAVSAGLSGITDHVGTFAVHSGMTEHYEVVATFQSRTGLVADEVENTFSFGRGTIASPAAFVVLVNALTDFYNATPAGSPAPVGSFFSPELSRTTGASKFTIYHRPATPGPLGTPVYGPSMFTLTATAGTALPGQDALCLSFHGDLTGIEELGPLDVAIPTPEAAQDMGAPATHTGEDRMRSRRRGRVYLGPLVQAAGAPGTFAEARPSATYRGIVAGAASALALAASDTSWDWEVFSRRDWTGYTITGGWVDDRFDTQRRRLEKATTRLLWSA